MPKLDKKTMARRVYERLPSNYKEEEGANLKLHELIYDLVEDIEDIAHTIMEFRDIDKAEGHTLDLIGGNVKEHRMGKDDATYRKWIKTKIIANLSRGDFNTLNRIASVILGESYLYAEETWNSKRYGNEPASIIINMLNHIPYYDIDRLEDVLAAGVSYKYNLLMQQGTNSWLGMATQSGEDATILPFTLTELNVNQYIYVGGISINSDKSTIYPLISPILTDNLALYVDGRLNDKNLIYNTIVSINGPYQQKKDGIQFIKGSYINHKASDFDLNINDFTMQLNNDVLSYNSNNINLLKNGTLYNVNTNLVLKSAKPKNLEPIATKSPKKINLIDGKVPKLSRTNHRAPVQDEAYNGHRRVRRAPYTENDFGLESLETQTDIVYTNFKEYRTYTDSVEVKPESNMEIRLFNGPFTHCVANKWTRVYRTYIARSANSEVSGIETKDIFNKDFTPWIEYRNYRIENGEKEDKDVDVLNYKYGRNLLKDSYKGAYLLPNNPARCPIERAEFADHRKVRRVEPFTIAQLSTLSRNFYNEADKVFETTTNEENEYITTSYEVKIEGGQGAGVSVYKREEVYVSDEWITIYDNTEKKNNHGGADGLYSKDNLIPINTWLSYRKTQVIDGTVLKPYSPSPLDLNNLKGVKYQLKERIMTGQWYTLSITGDLDEDKDWVGVWLDDNKFVGYLSDNKITFKCNVDIDNQYITLKSFKEQNNIQAIKLEKGQEKTEWVANKDDYIDNIIPYNYSLFNHTINRLKIYNKSLHEEEMMQLYNIRNYYPVIANNKIIGFTGGIDDGK